MQKNFYILGLYEPILEPVECREMMCILPCEKKSFGFMFDSVEAYSQFALLKVCYAEPDWLPDESQYSSF
jgi:hypothetical protein